MTNQLGDMTPVCVILSVCLAFIGILAIGYWIEETLKKSHPPRKGVPVKFYSREMCKAAHALSNEDDLEWQAQKLIKHINKEWRLKNTGENDEQSAHTW